MVRSIAVLPNRQIIAVGIDGNNDIALALFNGDGALDTSFATVGR